MNIISVNNDDYRLAVELDNINYGDKGYRDKFSKWILEDGVSLAVHGNSAVFFKFQNHDYLAPDKRFACGIWWLVTHPDHRREGEALALMKSLVNHCRSNGIRRICGHTGEVPGVQWEAVLSLVREHSPQHEISLFPGYYKTADGHQIVVEL